MKISLSKKRKGQQRHVTLSVDPREEFSAKDVIRQVILPEGVRPIREQRQGYALYRFHLRYFKPLLYTFPFADHSPGIRKWLDKQYPVPVEAPPLDYELEGFKGELYPFQRPAVKLMIENETFMLNDEMGLGKTVMILAALCETRALPALVVCPNNAKHVWARFVHQFTNLTCEVVEGTPAQREVAIKARKDIIIANVETLRIKRTKREEKISNPEFFRREWETLVADEHHRFKNPEAQQTVGFDELEANRVILASGTPILSRPEEIYVPLKKVDETFEEDYQSYWVFEQNLLVRDTNGYTVAYQPKTVYHLRQRLQEKSIRRRKEQVHDQLPKVLPITREVYLRGEQLRLYKRLEKEARMELADGSSRNVPSMLALITRLKQAAFSPELYDGKPASAKIEELKEVVEELVASGEKAIIFSEWAKATRIIQRELEDYNPAYVDGSVAPRDRLVQQDKFNEDDRCKLYIGTIGSNKEAITLNAATYVIFTDKDWVPANNEQAIARSAAGGLRGIGVDQVTVVDLIAMGTIEERIEERLNSKKNMFNTIVERDSGRSVERKTIKSIRELFEA